jgi:hypothetical protein
LEISRNLQRRCGIAECLLNKSLFTISLYFFAFF